MSIFRRKPKFRVGDRVQVNSLFLGAVSDLEWPLGRDVRNEYVGELAYVERNTTNAVPVWAWLPGLDRRGAFYEWELRPA